ncbi:MAG: PEP-CTERM sorting domain-containing protein [Armatimonadetes bacterium]|nr:PEP-CTERM sorting domain-containing protein [Armatimonadota bacterium]
MYRLIKIFAPALTLGLLLTASQASAQVNLFTSFEPVDFPPNSTDFTLGTPPNSAHFTGGTILTVGNPVAYRSGLYAWAILNQGTVGTIDFDNPSTFVSFYAINLFGGTSRVDVFDNANVNVGNITITGTDMMNNNSFISFVPGDFGATEIGKVTVTNLSAGGNQVWVDDFSATVIPEPATLLVLAGGLALAAARRRRRSIKAR